MTDLQTRMDKAGIRQIDLARRAGYAPPHVSKWLGGKVEPSIETMVNLDEAMEHLENLHIPEDFR